MSSGPLGLAMDAVGGKQVAPPAPVATPPAPQGMNLFSPADELERELADLSLLGPAARSNPAEVEDEAPMEEIEVTPLERTGTFAQEEQQPNFFTDLFGSMDNSLQSPAKLIGIGLLNQRNPGLGTALLAGGGLLSAFKKRRQRRRDG